MDSTNILLIIVVTLVSLASLLIPAAIAWKVVAPLLKRSAETRVLAMAQTGTTVNDQPEVRIALVEI
jgi:hypothetical protein